MTEKEEHFEKVVSDEEKKSKKEKKSKMEKKSKKEKKSSKRKSTIVLDEQHEGTSQSSEKEEKKKISIQTHGYEEITDIDQTPKLPTTNKSSLIENCDDQGTSDWDTGDERKIFLSRIPSQFTEESITQSFNRIFGDGTVEHVALMSDAKRDREQDLVGANHDNVDQETDGNETQEKEHRGFAFVTLSTTEKRNDAIEKGTVRAKVKETSKRKYTLYIRPIIRQDASLTTEDLDVCYLWKKYRCPYGNDCKFKHIGEGGCEEKKSSTEDDKKSKQKCFAYRTKGICKLGDKCPYRHDFEPNKKTSRKPTSKSEEEKDCINWKTKGKCRKGDKCPYRHDEAVREMLLAKKEKKTDKKKRGREEKMPQPLSVRVFGLNYDTTEEDVRAYFEHCGIIKEITFPTFEDSGRSKGYCGILFVSPKATEKACELDGQELHGRWLSVQPGKMYLKQWEQREQERRIDHGSEKEVGEFGQKVKKRKKHGYGE
jgi:RNA recognition motif-containing protein